MDTIVLALLAALVYPFIVAWLVGLGKSRRIENLERTLAELDKARHTAPAYRPVVPSVSKQASRPTSFYSVKAPPLVSQPKEEAPAAPAAVEPYRQDAPDLDVDVAPIAQPIDTQRSEQLEQPRTAPITQSESNTEPKPESQTAKWLGVAKTWLLTGNLVAKLGLVILFIGIAFLLKYVAARVTIPIELRLAAVVLADLGLLFCGWRLRLKRREVGLPIQGTAIAILMLVVFSAFQRYDLIPAGFAFALLVCLTAFTCLLAVLQDAPWLAAFGITGGFACPLLLSTGEGNHIALFSYYALLNAGVFALAMKKSWRPLNLLGFAFTFIVGSAWGYLRYTPAHYLSSQGFLILFFLCYVGISLAFAYQQQTRLKYYVDAILVLGTPLLAFGLQVALVKDQPFGIALSTLALGGFYLALASILITRGRERWRVMLEAYAALGVIFGTLALPFALDGRWTSGAWALEGAGFVWLGMRWQRQSIWLFGLLLQIGAGISFLSVITRLDPVAALSSNLGLVFLLLAASAFAVALNLRKNSGNRTTLSTLAASWLTLSAVWLLTGLWSEAIVRTAGGVLANWLVAGALFTGLLLYLIGMRMAWLVTRQLAMAAQIIAAIALGVVSVAGGFGDTMLETHGEQPLAGILMVVGAAFASSRMIQRAASPGQPASGWATALLLWAGFWWFGPAINIIAGRLFGYLPDSFGSSYARWTALYALGVAVTAIAGARLAPRLTWPQLRWCAVVCWAMLVLVSAGILHTLYFAHMLPDAASWIAWALLLASGEYVMVQWSAGGPALSDAARKLLHLLRTGGPWLALWPSGAILIDAWLVGPVVGPDSITQDSWVIGAAWGNYLPTWIMMLALVLLLHRSLAGKWPTTPLGEWYRAFFIPCATALLVALTLIWNLHHDGAMAPLPYLPLLNPLDLTTGFVLMMWASALRQLTDLAALHSQLLQRLRLAALVAAYLWLNLILLRSAAHYLDLDYRFADLAASQMVQAMLSLAWSGSALVLMRMAAHRTMRRSWWTGALVLGVVVLKLFVVDLDNSGGIARVISFVGVGLLLLLVGYFAPYPKAGQGMPPTASA